MRSPSVVWPRGLNPGVLAVLVCSLLVWSLLVLAGCDSGGNPGQTSSASVTASAGPNESATLSATPTPTATPSGAYKPADASGPAQNVPVPVLPEVAKTRTKEGLEAFTRYWFELLDAAYQSGDVSAVEKITADDCEFCNNITSTLKTNYQDGRWLVGGRFDVPAATTTFKRTEDGNYQVALQVLQDEIKYHQPGGSEFREPTAPSNTGNVLLATFSDSAWRVTGLYPLQ